MSFSLKIKKCKIYTCGKLTLSKTKGVHFRVTKHLAKAVFRIWENDKFDSAFYIPVKGSDFGEVTGTQDNASCCIKFRMDNDTNDYKCLCKGHKNNLEQLKDFSNDFSPDKFFEQEFSKVAKSKEHKLRKTDSSRTEGHSYKITNVPRESTGIGNATCNKTESQKNPKKRKKLHKTNTSDTVSKMEKQRKVNIELHKSPARTFKKLPLQDEKKTPPQVYRNTTSASKKKHRRMISGDILKTNSSSKRGQKLLKKAQAQNILKSRGRSASRPSLTPPVFSDTAFSKPSIKNSCKRGKKIPQMRPASHASIFYNNSSSTKQCLPEVSLGGGIVNLGNTCYMNAVLQAIISCSGFVQDMKRKCVAKAATKGIELKKNRLLYCGMISFLKCMSNAALRKTAVDPTANIRQAICKVFSNFDNTRQQDAHECFVNILNRIHEELLLCKIVPPLASQNVGLSNSENRAKTMNSTMWMKKWLETDKITDERNFEYLPTTRHFHIEIDNSLKCQNSQCSFARSNLELFRNLSLYLPQKRYNRAITLTELLDLYFNNEVVELKCEKCQMVGACKATKLHALPRVLVLHFKRFEANPFTGAFNKRRDSIAIDDTIDLAK